jgi:hypothetical protein
MKGWRYLNGDNHVLWKALNNSHSNERLTKVRINEAEYVSNSPSTLWTFVPDDSDSGIALDVTATTSTTSKSSTHLYIVEPNTHGETTTDLLPNLTQRSCSQLGQDVRQLHGGQVDRLRRQKNLDAFELMVLAGKKYNIPRTKKSRKHRPKRKPNSST